MAIGKNIRFHRETRLGITLDELSVRSNVDIGTISALEVRDSARSKYFAKIAHGLGLTLDQLDISPEDWNDAILSKGVQQPQAEYKSNAASKQTVIDLLPDNAKNIEANTLKAVQDLVINFLSLNDDNRDRISHAAEKALIRQAQEESFKDFKIEPLNSEPPKENKDTA